VTCGDQTAGLDSPTKLDDQDELTEGLPMTSQTSTPTQPDVSLERTGTRTYHAQNSRGATLEIGKGEGQWSPGDLLKAALLGCNAMSADSRLAHVLGDDFALSGVIANEYREDEDRFTKFVVELIPEFKDLDPEAEADTRKRALAAIARYCTVGHTLDHAVPHETIITRED